MNSKAIDKENPLGTERIGKLLVTFAIPSMISLVVNALYNVVDQIFIGNGVGYLGNGATNVIWPLTIIVIAFASLIGDGAAAYLSLKLGENDKEAAAKGVGTAISAIVLVGVILCVLLNLFLRPLCIMFGATEEILPYAMDYGRIICCAVIFAAIDVGAAGIIRADGSPAYSMIGLLVGCVSNIILDPIFIFALDWGVKGAAWATIIGEILNALIYLAYFTKLKTIELDKSCYSINGKMLATVCSLGISSFITQVALVLVMFVSNNALVKYGANSVYGAEIPMATMGITSKVYQIVTSVVIGLATGAQPIYGYNYGSGQKERVKQTYRLVLATVLIILALAWCVFQFAPMSIIQFFGKESDLYNEFAVKCFRIFLLVCPLNGIQVISGIFFQSIGKPKQATVLSLSRQIIYFIPATILLPLALGVDGALWAGALADMLAFFTALVMLKIYWKKI